MGKRLLFLLTLIGLFFVELEAFEEKISLGKDDQWSRLVLMDGLVLQKGFEGYWDLFLADGEYTQETVLPGNGESPRKAVFGVPWISTDASRYYVPTSFDGTPGRPSRGLLAHFNGGGESFPGDFYQWQPGTNLRYSTREKVLGNAALAFEDTPRPAVILINPGALLAAGDTPENFTIEFWLYPVRLSEGESVFLWEGAYKTADTILSQEIGCTVRNERLEWTFENFFLSDREGASGFTLRGESRLLPRRWQHHLIRYESLSGVLEYLIDGVPEALVYTTPTGRENSQIYLPRCGTMARPRITLGGNFVGLMDELRISPGHVSEPQLERYRRRSGTAVTEVFDLGNRENRLLRVDTHQGLPGNTAVSYYYRISGDLFLKDDQDLSWREFAPGEALDVPGRYVQILIELLPDGTGSLSPWVSSLDLIYEPKFPPLPPAYLIARPGDGSVKLTWDPQAEQGSLEYRVYFGEKPGDYFGAAGSGVSPVNVGTATEYTLTGLENGKLYYFAVTAVSSSGSGLKSEFSREVSARPSRLYRTAE